MVCVENPRVGGSIPPLATKRKPLSSKGGSGFSLWGSAQYTLSPRCSTSAALRGSSMKQHRWYSGREQHADEDSAARSVSTLVPAAPKLTHLRDGGLVLHRRQRSLLNQCRFKRPNGKWHRQSTGKASLEQAIPRACDIYDEARYRLRLGLAHRTDSAAMIERHYSKLTATMAAAELA